MYSIFDQMKKHFVWAFCIFLNIVLQSSLPKLSESPYPSRRVARLAASSVILWHCRKFHKLFTNEPKKLDRFVSKTIYFFFNKMPCSFGTSIVKLFLKFITLPKFVDGLDFLRWAMWRKVSMWESRTLYPINNCCFN